MASAEQRILMKAFYDGTGFEFLYSDEAKAGDRAGFVRLWKHNCDWLEGVVVNMQGLINDYEADS